MHVGRRMTTLKKLLRKIGHLESSFTVAEVGVHCGHTSQYLLEVFPRMHLMMVDPWDCAIPFDGVLKSRREVHGWRMEALRRTRKHRDRTTIVRQLSVDAAAICPDGSQDLVFIDADHFYDSVRTDIAHWYSKVRCGGILCGHDYGKQFEGVARAVDEWGAESGKEITVGKAMVWWTTM